MATPRAQPVPEDNVPPASGKRLEGWKEIAAYLKRDVRTVGRWEKLEGLPIHRHPHNKLATVWADTAELDAWRDGVNKRMRRDLKIPPGWEPLCSAETARRLLILLSVVYLVMYAAALFWYWDVVQASGKFFTGPLPGLVWGVAVIVAAAVGGVVRTHVLTALCFDYSYLGWNFKWLFPAILVLDLIWTSSPFLIEKLQLTAFLCSGALAFSPFAQRRLLYCAYAPGGGRIGEA